MIQRILLDLDDVCNQMTMWTLLWVGCDVDPLDDSSFPVECGYDIVAACNQLHPNKHDWTVREFWDAIPRQAWATVPESREFHWLLKQCERLVGREIYLCTSPTQDPDCLAGKLEWIHEHCPGWLHRQYAITPRKHIGANPRTLLIDDRNDNCLQFIANGGKACLVPRPWNPSWELGTKSTLETFFKNQRSANGNLTVIQATRRHT